MGSAAEFQSPAMFEGGGGSNGYSHGRPHSSTQTKATVSGMTALASVAALLIR